MDGAPGEPRWAERALGWLAYPANLAAANLVWFVLALPLVTWLPATVALLGAIDRWQRGGDERMMRGVVAAWGRTWRRTVPLGLVSTLAAVVLAANALFLSTRPPGVATVLLGGVGVLGLVWLSLHVWLLPVVAVFPDLPARRWVAEAAALAVANPLVTLVLAAFVVLSSAVLVWLFTLVPFFGASVFGLLALRAVYHATGPGA